ncbi:hypothetical protein Tco_0163790 [Tanacetum coccineum]
MQASKDPFMVSKHQEARIKDLMRKSKGLDLLKILMSHVYIKRLFTKCKVISWKMFPMKDLGEAAFILGTKIYRDRSNRIHYVCEILVYGGNPEAELRVDCYCDAGFETDRDDTKSQTGHVFVLNGGAVD